MRLQVIPLVLGAALVIPTSVSTTAQRNEKNEAARDLAVRVGQLLGAASVCREIARPRIKNISDMLMDVLKNATSSADELNAFKQTYDKSIAEGQRAVTSRRIECATADRDLAGLESAVTSPSATAPATVPPGVTAFTGAEPSGPVPARPAPPVRALPPAPVTPVGPNPAAQFRSALAPTLPAPAVSSASPLLATNVNIPRGVSDDEIRFGIAAPFSGATKELGHHMKLGIEAAFNEVNASGGVHSRQLRLISADDGYEPTRTMEAMRQLYEADQVFGTIGNVGTPTAAVSLPFALERKMLFYGAFTGANLLRRDPPDRYVFNYRASYVEETDAVVRYLVKLRRLRPDQIAVFAQQDAYGDAGFAGVAKAIRALRGGNG